MKNIITPLLILTLCFAFLIQSSQCFTTGINSVVANLADYQTNRGGFALEDTDPDLETTEQALFLSSLFGLRDKIKTSDVLTFVDSLHNSDHGYSNKPGQASDLESLRAALLSYAHLGKTVSNPADITKFISSLYDRDRKQYANNVGGAGDIKHTAIAYQCLQSLNSLSSISSKEKQDALDNLKSIMKTTSDNKIKYFSSITSDNYYAVAVAQYVGFDFGDIHPWAAYFSSQQVLNGNYAGGFYSDREQTEINVEDAAHALSALYILQKVSKVNLVRNVNGDALLQYSSLLPHYLPYAAQVYTAIAQTQSFYKLFKYETTFETNHRLIGDRIIQGTDLKPALLFKSSFGVLHSGLTVAVTATHLSSGDIQNFNLVWNEEGKYYTSSESYATADKLGEVRYNYSVQWSVPDLSENLSLNIKSVKTIGYDLTVRPSVIHAGSTVSPGGQVGSGAQFNFDVSLGTLATPKLLSGDFDVVFRVRDSSWVIIHESTKDARKNSGTIKFDYNLKSLNIPSGDLIFDFLVKDSEGVHSSHSLTYNLPITMVAGDITFDGHESGETPSYKIGDTVTVHMIPASIVDSRTPLYYSADDALSKPAERQFHMVISSAETHEIIFTVLGGRGVIGGKVSYTFTFPVEPTFAAIGTNHITFQHESGNGKLTELKNYDSSSSEIIEESYITYKVDTKLQLVDLKNSPKDGNLEYGSEVRFSFKVRDELTKKFIYASNVESNVYLALRHLEDGRTVPFTSSRSPANMVYNEKDQTPDHFQINWAVNPNAVKGKGYLELVALGGDGKEVLIEQESGEWKVNVEIGGNIDVEENIYSSVVGDSDAIFFVEVELTCQKKKLSDAQLKATVSFKSKADKVEVLSSLPVAHGNVPGHYQVSWLQDKARAKAGVYVVDFYREADQHRVVTGSELQPFFSVSVKYEPDTGSPLPVKTEVLVAFILGAAFLWSSFKKMSIEDLKQIKK